MNPEQDPEVRADLAKRAATEREPRKGCAYDWTPPKVVDKLPCRTGCGAMVPVTQNELDAFAKGNETMRAAGFKPLSRAEMATCPPCKLAHEQRLADQRSQALLPRQTELPRTSGHHVDASDLARYLPTPRSQRAKRPLKP